jgi:hypothetical protein
LSFYACGLELIFQSALLVIQLTTLLIELTLPVIELAASVFKLSAPVFIASALLVTTAAIVIILPIIVVTAIAGVIGIIDCPLNIADGVIDNISTGNMAGKRECADKQQDCVTFHKASLNSGLALR